MLFFALILSVILVTAIVSMMETKQELKRLHQTHDEWVKQETIRFSEIMGYR